MTNEEFERIKKIAKKISNESYTKYRLGTIGYQNINDKQTDKIDSKKTVQRRNVILRDLSERKIFPYIKEDKIIFKRISFNFDNAFFKYLDEELGIKHKYIEEYSHKQEDNHLFHMFGIDKIEEQIMDYFEFTELISKNPEYKDNLDKLVTSYNKNNNLTNYTFKLTTYLEHSKIYLIIKSIMNVFDLSQIYLDLCKFFNLECSYNILSDRQYSNLHSSAYTKEFTEKEKNLNIYERKELLKLIFSYINIDIVCQVKFNIQDEVSSIYTDIASKNTAILNDESFKTIIGYINEKPYLDKTKCKIK